jgi:regulatory protein
LSDTLRSRNVPDDVAERVLDRFEEVGLVNDRMFAQMWVESRTRTRNLSTRALRRELQIKGVADHLIAEALEMVTAEDEVAGARRIVARKVSSVTGLPRTTQYRRLAGALARKGYSAAVAATVVREALAAAEHEAAELEEAERAEPLDSNDLL